MSLEFFPGCIEAKEVPFACSEPTNVPNQSLTSDLQETSPPSTAGQESSPPVSLSQITSKSTLKSSPKSPIRARLAASSSQENKYSGWTTSKRSWSYHPYQPRDNPQLSSSAVSSPGKGSPTVSQPSGAGASQQEPGSCSTWPEETPVLVIFTRLHKDEDLSVHALRHYIQSNIRCLLAPPRGSDESKHEAAPSDRAVQPSLTTSSDPGAYEANPLSAARNLASAPSRSTRDNTQLQEVALNITPQFKLEKDDTDISTLGKPAQNSGPRVWVKEQPEAVEISALVNTHCGSLKNEVCSVKASCLCLRCV